MNGLPTDPTSTKWRRVVAMLAALAIAPVASLSCGALARFAAGENRSDVGVRMYERAGLGLAVGLTGYVVIGLGALWIVRRTLDKGTNYVQMLGLPTYLAILVLHAMQLIWSYG